MAIYNICLYGAASHNIDEIYHNKVYELGAAIALRGHTLLYGGGALGLMGAAAKGAVAMDGKVIGVTTDFIDDFEPTFKCTELITVETMAERKAILEEKADAFIIVPGGIGTYDEFFQVLTLKELGQLDKPIVLFNVNGYYDYLLAAMVEGARLGFIRDGVMESFKICETANDVLDTIENELK